jgi:hypothetical protein
MWVSLKRCGQWGDWVGYGRWVVVQTEGWEVESRMHNWVETQVERLVVVHEGLQWEGAGLRVERVEGAGLGVEGAGLRVEGAQWWVLVKEVGLEARPWPG